MARPCQTTSLSPPGDIRVPPSFSLQSTYPDQSGSTSTQTNTPFMQKGENEAPLRIQCTLTNTPFMQNLTVEVLMERLLPGVSNFFLQSAVSKPNSFTVLRARRFTCLTEFQAEFIPCRVHKDQSDRLSSGLSLFTMSSI